MDRTEYAGTLALQPPGALKVPPRFPPRAGTNFPPQVPRSDSDAKEPEPSDTQIHIEREKECPACCLDSQRTNPAPTSSVTSATMVHEREPPPVSLRTIPPNSMGTGERDTMLELLCECVTLSLRHGRGVLVTNFPRDLRQALEYEAKMGEPSAVMLLDCSPDTMFSRLQCPVLSRSAPQSTGCHRDRDTSRRVEGFTSNCQPVTSHYQPKRLLHKIDAERPPEEVFAQICQAMDSC
ncbi:adenylate kinase isoenzyme 1-like [Salvelinus alpinus]